MEKEQINIKGVQKEKPFTFKLHTIIMLVGPDGAGKSLFSKYLAVKLREACSGSKKMLRTPVISFDDIAYDLIGYSTIDKHSIEFQYVKEQTEEVMFSKLKAVTSYPLSSEFAILDYTALTPEFRDKVIAFAEEQDYNLSAITFDFEDSTQYQKPYPGQIKAMRRAVSGGMSAKLYQTIDSIKSRDEIYSIQVSVPDSEHYSAHLLEGDSKDYLIIGDIHGCYDELIALIQKEGFIVDKDLKVTHPTNKKVLLIGDLIDKGRDIAKVVEFAHANIGTFIMVTGNHESFVYRVLNNLIPSTSVSDLVKREFFESIDLFLADEILKNKFFEVYLAMKDFYIHRDFIVTHAPCDVRFLGKMSPSSRKSMRDFKYPKTRDFEHFAQFIYEFDESLEFLKIQASDSQPLHIFGHVVTTELSKFKNKVAIDTGCATGGELTGIYVLSHGRITSVSEKSLTSKKDKHKFYKFF